MDDVLDEFMPLTITGIPSKSRNDVSLSQTPSLSRLSRSYAKVKKKSACERRSANVDHPYVNCAVESMVTTVDTNQHDSHCRATANGLQFCPVCQAPFDIIKIDPHVHVNECNVTFSKLKGKYI
jgi:hypothetical protein